MDDKGFNRDVELLRTSDVSILASTYENIEEFEDGVNADEIPSPLRQVMMRHELPLVMEDFIYHYVANDEIDLSKLRSGVYIVDHKAMSASGVNDDEVHNYQAWYVNDTMQNKYVEVTLAIPVHATITQITDTIAQYKQFIKDRQTAANGDVPVKRVRLLPMVLRDSEIMRLYHLGLKPREILWKLPEDLRGILTAPDIAKIINKQKKKS